MKFLNVCLKNESRFHVEDTQGQLICKFLNAFIQSNFVDMEFEYTLNIKLVSDTTYWGQVRIENKIVKELELKTELFKDFLVDNIGDDERSCVIAQRNNTILHELIHIRNRLEYDINNKRDFSTEKGIKDALIEYMIDEYLAEYESNKTFKALVRYTEQVFVDELTVILTRNTGLNTSKDNFKKIKDIIYKISVLAAHKHFEQQDDYSILSNECKEISAANRAMFNIIGESLWFYNWSHNLEITKRKLSPVFNNILGLLYNDIKIKLIKER